MQDSGGGTVRERGGGPVQVQNKLTCPVDIEKYQKFKQMKYILQKSRL